MATARMMAMSPAVCGTVVVTRSRVMVGFNDHHFRPHVRAEHQVCHRGEVVGRNAAEFELEARFKLVACLGVAGKAREYQGDAGRDNTLCASLAQLRIAI